MKTYDIAIVGSGMGGSMIASLNKDKNIILFERDKNLGGCASTFKRFGKYFNAGATTFVGYENNHLVKKIFDKAGFTPDIKESKVAIRVIQNNNIIDRVKDFDKFLENINRIYPNKNNELFWKKIKQTDEKFWQIKKLFYSKYSFKSYFKTFISVIKLLRVFKFDLFKSADSFIQESLGDISKEYKDFIDSQLLITLQTKSKDISFLSMALGLSYPFHKVFYVQNGMGELFSGLLKEVEVRNKEEIISIKKEDDLFKLRSSKGTYFAKELVLNSSIYNSQELFEDNKIKAYYNKFSFSDQSAFVINLSLKSKEEFLNHYQVILSKNIPNSISNSFFISFSSQEDKKLSKDALSVTISTHTKASFWKNLNKEEYEKQKQLTQEFIINELLKNFDSITKEDIINIFSATSSTFKRYINRYNCGGKAITLKNILQTPSCKTPFKGLYNIGDTVFAGQGWPGVAIGVNVLNEELNG